MNKAMGARHAYQAEHERPDGLSASTKHAYQAEHERPDGLSELLFRGSRRESEG